MENRVDPEMFLFFHHGLVLVPQLRRLIFIVPFELGVPRREIPLFCPDSMFIPSDTQKDCLQSISLDHRFQGIRLQLIAAIQLASPAGAHSLLQFLLISSNQKFEIPLFCPIIPELIHLRELITGIDMDDRKGDSAKEGLSA